MLPQRRPRSKPLSPSSSCGNLPSRSPRSPPSPRPRCGHRVATASRERLAQQHGQRRGRVGDTAPLSKGEGRGVRGEQRKGPRVRGWTPPTCLCDRGSCARRWPRRPSQTAPGSLAERAVTAAGRRLRRRRQRRRRGRRRRGGEQGWRRPASGRPALARPPARGLRRRGGGLAAAADGGRGGGPPRRRRGRPWAGGCRPSPATDPALGWRACGVARVGGGGRGVAAGMACACRGGGSAGGAATKAME